MGTSKRRSVVGALGIVGACSIAAFGAASHQACAVYDSSLIGSSEGGEGDSLAGGDAGVPACNHAYPPDRPQGVDDSGGDNIGMLVAAFNSIDIGVSGGLDAAVPQFGYDLDHTCTCFGGMPSCLQPPQPPGAPSAESCDDNRGRDNTDILLFRDLPGLASTGTSQIDQGLTAGQYGLLLVITDYNGKSDDPRVHVDFYLSDGLSRDADGGIPTPRFDGTDLWTRDLGSLQGGQPNGQPQYSDDSAYVSGSVLVANFSQLPIAFGDRSFLGAATMQLIGAVIVGQLQAKKVDSGGFGFALVGGTIAGRWPTSQLLSTLANIPGEGGFLCATDPVNKLKYGIIREVVCAGADIATVSTEDNNTPLAPCDAISVGMTFTAEPAQLGPVVEGGPVLAGCADGGVAFSDHCSQ
jgi:hypothetical protein